MRNIRYAVWAIIMFASITSRGELTYSYTSRDGVTTHGLSEQGARTLSYFDRGSGSTPQSSGNSGSSGGCYIATAVYGSYDCPQVWTLRRYRDNTLASTSAGRCFIHTYDAVSPTLVRWFGKNDWFVNTSKGILDKFVQQLNEDGVSDLPYDDKQL